MASKDLIEEGECVAIASRSLDQQTCEKFDMRKAKVGGKWVLIANYRDPDGKRVVAQKVRDGEKNFHVRGDLKEAGLYGQWLWRDKGKMVVVTEGEIDALSVSQCQQNKWPVVSVPTGAKGARKALAAQLDWLLGFDTVVLMFDSDEPGREAAAECAPLFPPGRVKIATIEGFKDANEALMAGQPSKIIDAMWGAREFRPDGIVSVADVAEDALRPVEMGRAWPWEKLTALTYGRRPGEVYMLGAGTGVGKSEWFDQVIAHILTKERCPVAVFKFEQPVGESVKRIAGKIAGRLFHVPDSGWTPDELRKHVERLQEDDRLFLYNHFGQCEWTVVEDHIRYLVAAKGVRDVFVDHLTAMADTGDDERGSLERIMKQAATLAQELGICLYMISHLTTPEGKPHEEGGRVTIRHFKGSRAIGFWSHFMFGLERDQQDSNEERRGVTTFRILKDRYTGRSVGHVIYLKYDKQTGRLDECDKPEDAEDHGFKRTGSGAKASDSDPF